MSEDPEDKIERALRWRMVLGQYADRHLPYDDTRREAERLGEAGEGARAHVEEGASMDGPLSFIYDREFLGRQHRARGSRVGHDTVNVPRWLGDVRRLFPKEAAHILEQDALVRYGLTELVTDPEILRTTEPSEDLLRAIMAFKHLMGPKVLDAAREVVRKVVEQISARLEKECAPALHGTFDPTSRAPHRSHRNLDWRKTVGRNLKHFDPQRGKLVVDRLFYRHRQRHKRSWRIIVAVDQSGSMTDSLIHSAVMAAIFASLPALEVHLILWDHRVVDVSDLITDPVQILMGAQLGGGTQLLPAMRYAADLITRPDRTIFVVLSDWYLWREERACLDFAKELAEAGVKGVGLNALDRDVRPVYNERFARDLAGAGWTVATMTPQELAAHVGRMIA